MKIKQKIRKILWKYHGDSIGLDEILQTVYKEIENRSWESGENKVITMGIVKDVLEVEG